MMRRVRYSSRLAGRSRKFHPAFDVPPARRARLPPSTFCRALSFTLSHPSGEVASTVKKRFFASAFGAHSPVLQRRERSRSRFQRSAAEHFAIHWPLPPELPSTNRRLWSNAIRTCACTSSPSNETFMPPSSAPFVDAETPRSAELAAVSQSAARSARALRAPALGNTRYYLPFVWTCVNRARFANARGRTNFLRALLDRIRGLAPLTAVIHLGVARRLAGPVRLDWSSERYPREPRGGTTYSGLIARLAKVTVR
jgi:hypothetical protein